MATLEKELDYVLTEINRKVFVAVTKSVRQEVVDILNEVEDHDLPEVKRLVEQIEDENCN